MAGKCQHQYKKIRYVKYLELRPVSWCASSLCHLQAPLHRTVDLSTGKKTFHTRENVDMSFVYLRSQTKKRIFIAVKRLHHLLFCIFIGKQVLVKKLSPSLSIQLVSRRGTAQHYVSYSPAKHISHSYYIMTMTHYTCDQAHQQFD